MKTVSSPTKTIATSVVILVAVVAVCFDPASGREHTRSDDLARRVDLEAQHVADLAGASGGVVGLRQLPARCGVGR